jgi:hypothetical protein
MCHHRRTDLTIPVRAARHLPHAPPSNWPRRCFGATERQICAQKRSSVLEAITRNDDHDTSNHIIGNLALVPSLAANTPRVKEHTILLFDMCSDSLAVTAAAPRSALADVQPAASKESDQCARM